MQLSDTTEIRSPGGLGTSLERSIVRGQTKRGLLAGGSLLGAIASLSCCVLPYVIFSLGITTVWIGRLAHLAPYQPIFIAIALGFVAAGFYAVYRKPKAEHCELGSYCASRTSIWITQGTLWLSTALVIVALTISYWLPLFD